MLCNQQFPSSFTFKISQNPHHILYAPFSVYGIIENNLQNDFNLETLRHSLRWGLLLATAARIVDCFVKLGDWTLSLVVSQRRKRVKRPGLNWYCKWSVCYIDELWDGKDAKIWLSWNTVCKQGKACRLPYAYPALNRAQKCAGRERYIWRHKIPWWRH